MESDELRELLSSNHKQTLEYFFTRLVDIDNNPNLTQKERLYVASILAHFSQVSCASADDMPTPRNLVQVFDMFVLDDTLAEDADSMEAAGAQIMLLAGFFRDQMNKRHNVRWYDRIGAAIYNRAARLFSRSNKPNSSQVASLISVNFSQWTVVLCRLSRDLRDEQYLIRINPESEKPEK